MDGLQQTPMAKPPQDDDDDKREINDRLRRIETRLTKFMEWMGFDTGVRRPEFTPGRLDIPTDATSLRDCLAALPEVARNKPIEVMHKGQHVATLIPRQ